MRWTVLVLWAVAAAAPCGTVAYSRLGFRGAAEHGVFAADLDGDGAQDLMALGRGRISVYRGRRGQPYPKTPEVVMTGSAGYFADVADVHPAPGQELVIITASGVSCFVQRQGRFVPEPVAVLEDCDTILSLPLLRGAVKHVSFASVDCLPWNFAFDADGDGDDDLLVAHGDGTDVYLQGEPGKFAEPVRLRLFPLIFHSTMGAREAKALGGAQTGQVRVVFEMRPVERRDVNGDGNADLFCPPVRRGDFVIAEAIWFAQKIDGGGFDPIPATLPAGFTLGADRTRRDVNGDGRLDRIAEENSMDDPFNITTRVRYFLADAQGRIPSEPTHTVVGQNILVHTDLPVHDFNGDGALDFAMLKTDISATQVAKWMRQSFGKIDGKLNFYLFDRDDNRYPRYPSWSKDVRMRFKVDLQDVMVGGVWERYLSTMVRFAGDYNGDGRPDLLIRERTHAIAIYLNTGDRGEPYPRRPDIVLDELPMFGGLDVADLNGDGADDLILSAPHPLFSRASLRPEVIAVYVSRRP
ncbi:MAG: FG-GAP repeat domain-containing protein [Planctomycetota bacterium]